MAETGKERSRRIDTDYHRQVDAPVKLKRALALLATLIGIGYTGCLLYSSIQQHQSAQLSTGDLSRAHAVWNAEDCENCHTPNVPIRTDALWGTDPHHIQLNNQKCVSCHSAPGHFAALTQDNVLKSESCSSCHREHLGAEQDLARVDDIQCVRCHADLTKFSIPGRSEHRANVTSFSTAGAHPEFRSLKSDPGTINFSHVQHMRPGQPLVPGDQTALTLDRIPKEYRERYADPANATTEIKLDCNDCHEPDSAWPNPTDRLNPTATAVSDHRFYQPIRFERHCIACHQLPFDLPHGLNRQATFQSLEKSVAIEALKDVAQADPVARAQLLKARAVTIFANGEMCYKCHKATVQDDADLVVPAKIPPRWLAGAVFLHGSHMDVACIRCHATAYAHSDQLVNSQTDADNVMIAGIEICSACHISEIGARARRMRAGEKLIASGECIECHRYHVDEPRANAPTSDIPSPALAPNEARPVSGGD